MKNITTTFRQVWTLEIQDKDKWQQKILLHSTYIPPNALHGMAMLAATVIGQVISNKDREAERGPGPCRIPDPVPVAYILQTYGSLVKKELKLRNLFIILNSAFVKVQWSSATLKIGTKIVLARIWQKRIIEQWPPHNHTMCNILHLS
jgi:hypothetical protein